MKFAGFWPLVVSAGALQTGCAAGDPEAAVRATLDAVEAAAEQRDIGFFRDFVGPTYRDSRGNDRDQLLAMLRGYFIANQRIEVLARVEDVKLEGPDAARVVMHAGLLGQRAGQALLGGTSGESVRLELELVADGGEWQLIGLAWQRAAGE
jgi:hypothetical protein